MKLIYRNETFREKETNKEITYKQPYIIVGGCELAIKAVFKNKKDTLLSFCETPPEDK